MMLYNSQICQHGSNKNFHCVYRKMCFTCAQKWMPGEITNFYEGILSAVLTCYLPQVLKFKILHLYHFPTIEKLTIKIEKINRHCKLGKLSHPGRRLIQTETEFCNNDTYFLPHLWIMEFLSEKQKRSSNLVNLRIASLEVSLDLVPGLSL